MRVKEQLKEGWQCHGTAAFSVSACYKSLIGDQPTFPWTFALWSRAASPRYSFISCVCLQKKLPVLDRLARFNVQHLGTTCPLCSAEEENHDHLFFTCTWSQELWGLINTWWPSNISHTNLHDFTMSLKRLKNNCKLKHITFAI